MKNITPEKLQCVAGTCPAVYSTEDGRVIVIGKKVDLEEAGLTEEVADDELAIAVDAEMLDQTDFDQ